MNSIKGILLGLVVLAGVRYAVTYGVRAAVTSATTSRANCVVMVGNTTREVDGGTYIVGSIRNDCERRIDHVTINFRVDRPADSNLGRSEVPVYAYSNDLEPGQTQPFKTLFPLGKNTIYRYEGLTAY